MIIVVQSNEPEDDVGSDTSNDPEQQFDTDEEGNRLKLCSTENSNNVDISQKISSLSILDRVKQNNYKDAPLQPNGATVAKNDSKDAKSIIATYNPVIADCGDTSIKQLEIRRKSTATLTVVSPRNSPQEGKPKRVLKVRTTSLSNGSHIVTDIDKSSTAAGRQSSTDSPTSRLPTTGTTTGTPTGTPTGTTTGTTIGTTTATAAVAAGNHFQSHFSSTEPANSLVTKDTSKSKTDTTSAHSRASSDTPTFSDTVRLPLSSHSWERTRPSAVSPRRISDMVSPRSDISNLATPRSLTSTPRLPVSSILELDMPETSVDNNHNWSDVPVTPGGGGGVEMVSDKISFTTDESGFTSASSDSDITLTAPGN